ncbi:MAG: GHMP kinase, partial [Chloroflexi bacterium]|nr:GHMP kinase [Chloroflexota bacterium]
SMLIARAPVRISFAGGGTDLPAYYEKYGGMVVSATIDKYFYVILNVSDYDGLQIASSDYSTFYRYSPEVDLLWDGDLSLPRAIVHHFGLHKGLSMFLASEVPPGTGLGSSSSVAVAVVKALSTLCGQSLSKQEIAELASFMEIEKLRMPIGKQDQYAAAFGGLNAITFRREGVTVKPVQAAAETLKTLECNILLFFTGTARNSAEILSRQRDSSARDDPQVIESLHAIKAMAQETLSCFEKGNLRRYGELLHVSWQRKKQLAPGITNPLIDECYDLAQQKGAMGGKITGAGGGGFLMLYCEEPYHEQVTQALESHGLKRMDFRFDHGGVRVLVHSALPLRGEVRV